MPHKSHTERKEYMRLYYAKNADLIKEKARAWYAKKREHVRATQKQWQVDHREDWLAKRRIRYAANTSKLKLERRKPSTRYSRAKSGAKYFGRSWSIPFLIYVELISLPCFYCNASVTEETGSGLDRVDNNLGYEVGNVLTCCAVCNRIRMDVFTVEEMKILGKLKAELFAARITNAKRIYPQWDDLVDRAREAAKRNPKLVEEEAA